MSTPLGSARTPLASLAFFAGATDSELRELDAISRPVSHPAGTILFREGSELDELFIVVEGTVSIEILGADHRLKRIQTVGSGELLGWSPILGSSTMTATARTLTAVELVVFDATAMRQLCEAQPHFGYLFLRRVAAAIASRLSATRLQLLDVFRHDLPEVTTIGVRP